MRCDVAEAIPGHETYFCSLPRAEIQSPPWTVPARYRIITVFLTLVVRGSCDSSSSSCYPRVPPATRPRHGPTARPFTVSISFVSNRLGAQLCLELAPVSTGSSAFGDPRSCPAGSDRRHHSQRQPPHPGRHGQGPHLYQGRRRLRHRLHRTRLQRPVEHRLL